MNTKDLTYIVDIEMMKFGNLSKGLRWEIVRMAKSGRTFEVEVSTDDYNAISANLRRQGLYIMSCKKVGENRKLLTFNPTV